MAAEGAASRRRALRLLTGGALGSALALLGRDEGTAACPRRRRCGKGTCCPKGQVCGDKTTKTCVTGKGTCEAGANVCKFDPEVSGSCASSEGGPITCFCWQSTEGATRCGTNFLDNCDNCTDSGDCRALFPNIPGAFCAKGEGTCCGPKQGVCVAPCP